MPQIASPVGGPLPKTLVSLSLPSPHDPATTLGARVHTFSADIQVCV
eukprot:CAMPEP_0173387808 /NCGR_PEP_ID=MMETSP1356-20130122/10252_1 /TAXON_ID=77927 ORGANISM="Hemiselmis virescens, Strain PCC157" /NCGR_SAMPLE_ID=MMETSP1356 /ASSEMBLY_ACC=CAM_ASM_000847 /LENGTH=46 /DNA_ID= /DNA_START= /DNA_END= /DNA_ORIENTATION=